MGPNGTAVRLDTQIDIPVEIGVPHFIQDEHMEEAGGLLGNFKLSLQSVVCHRGHSVDSGHYIALVRGTTPPTSSDGPRTESSKTWMRFDDLAPHRITVVDIEKAGKEETPYLLFYQIVPVDGDPGHITTGEEVLTSTTERNTSVSEHSSVSALNENQPVSGRPSLELPIREDDRGRPPTTTRTTSAKSLPEQALQPLSDASVNVPQDAAPRTDTWRLSQSLSRSQNKATEGLGRTISKLAQRKSREIPAQEADAEHQPEVHVTEIRDRTGTEKHGRGEHPKSHKREKSRLGRSKVRGEKPDRECSVM